MNFSNQILGICTVLLSAVCFFLAFSYFKKGNYVRSLLLIFFCGLILRFFAGMDFHLHPWDERYHALAAKNLLRHPLKPTLYEEPIFEYDYRSWTNNHIWVHKPPLPLWLIMLSLQVFGINEMAVRLPSIVLSSLGILLTYYIGKHFFDEKVGLLASFFYSINGFLIDLATARRPTDHPDTMFIFFIELGIFLSVYYVRRPSNILLLLIGIATGCGVLTKWLPALLVVAVLFLLLIRQESWKRATAKCIVVTLVAAAVAIPWQVFIYSAYAREAAWESYFNYRHLIEPLDGHKGTVFFYLALMPRVFGELIYIPVIMFFHALARKRLPPQSTVLGIWFIVPYLFFSFVATKMPGYVMISAPALFIILSWAFWTVKSSLDTDFFRKTRILFLALLLLLPVRYSLERIKAFQNIDRNPSWAQELRELNRKIPPSKAVVFNVDYFIEAMFYADVTAYPFVPTREQIQQARGKGFAVFIFDNSLLPSDIRSDSTVTILPRK